MSRIQDGTGSNTFARVAADNRLTTDAITEPISAERSRKGLLFGAGTGFVTLAGTESFAPMLWLKNSGTDYDFYVQKFIFGWDGGTTNFNRTVGSFIRYQMTVPTANNADASPGIENISKSGTSAPVTDPDATAWKWDEVGSSGMTGGTGGFLQIPNRISQGNTSIHIDGEIILGPGDTMQMEVIATEAGEYNVAIVYYKVLTGKVRGET